MERKGMQSFYRAPSLQLDWEEARRFHGHLGPWLALGMKMGAEGMRILGARPHFGVQVVAGCRPEPPVSCLVDGLQWMTGATYGKRNIVLQEQEEVVVSMRNMQTGAEVAMTLLPGIPGQICQWFEKYGDEVSARKLWEMPAERLFCLHSGGLPVREESDGDAV
jgi:formylmethanofuran dehydrogenase subunit E